MIVGFKRVASLIFLCAALSACASPAEVQNMVVTKSSVSVSGKETPFSNAILIKQVDGGEDTNPLWTSEVGKSGFREALRSSMQQTGFLASSASATKFDLHATLSKVAQPLVGLNFTVTSYVRYRLIQRSTLKTWFDEEVSAAYTATFGDSLLGVQRLRLANEGSIRENIRLFIQRLAQQKAPLS